MIIQSIIDYVNGEHEFHETASTKTKILHALCWDVMQIVINFQKAKIIIWIVSEKNDKNDKMNILLFVEYNLHGLNLLLL